MQKLFKARWKLSADVISANGGVPKTLEGEWGASKIVVVEFASTEQAEAWWDSEEYRPLKALRREASTTRVLLVDDN